MEFYLEQSQLGASTGMETGTFPTHSFGPNLKWQVCFAQLKHGEPQLLKDRHLQTDPVTAAPQPIRLQETYIANTTQDTARTGQLPWAPGKTACWDLALLMYCSGDILSQLLQSQQRADAIPVLGGFRNSLEHLEACGSSQTLSVCGQPKEHGTGGTGAAPACPSAPTPNDIGVSCFPCPSVGTGVFPPAHSQILWPPVLATSWCLSLPAWVWSHFIAMTL